MDGVPFTARQTDGNWYDLASCSLEELRVLAARRLHPSAVPLATRVEGGQVPVYDCAMLRTVMASGAQRDIMAEWVRVLKDGPGIVVLERAFANLDAVDRANEVFDTLIARQHTEGKSGADHFAKAGANDRIWNALEKLCREAPEVFAEYYENDMISLISEAWLGPAYQITSQVNVVNPGGVAQTPHRDYHLGFQSAERVMAYPIHVHLFSPMLTLQGAVAHCDMPLESGPTLYMPFTQQYGPGYLAAQSQEIRDWFMANCTQLPLRKGDAVFFNPALLHAAGSNRSADIRRSANLLQISSPYGRAMETVDRVAMAETIYPVLLHWVKEKRRSVAAIDNVIAASADGYSFPTNLDKDPPLAGLAPESQQELMRRALSERWEPARFNYALDERDATRLS